MCNFDGFFRLLKEMSIAQNLYVNVSIVLFTITFVLAGLITIINFLTNNYSYLDMTNIVDNMEFWELDMYIQTIDNSMIDQFNDYGLIFSIFSNIENFYGRTGNKFLMKDEIYDFYVKNALVFDDKNLQIDVFTNFEKENSKLFNKLNLTNLRPVLYSQNNIINEINSKLDQNTLESNFYGAKVLMKHGFLFLNMLRNLKFIGFDLTSSTKQTRFVDRIFLNLRDANAYFYITGEKESFNFNPEYYKDLITEKYLQMARKIYNSQLYCNTNKNDLLLNLAGNPLFLERDEISSSFFKDQNSNLVSKSIFKPQLLGLYNTYERSYIESLKMESIDNYDENTDPFEFNNNLTNNDTLKNKIKEVFLNSKQNFFIFSDMDFLENLGNSVFSHSNYQIIPLFAKADEKMELLNKNLCYLFRQILNKGTNKNISVSDMKTLKDCFLDDMETPKTKFWDGYLENSPSLLNLNSSSYFDFCTYNDISDNEENFRYINETFPLVPKKFCLNRFSTKQRIENSEGIKKNFKIKNSIIPLLSLNTEKVNFTITNYYLSVFLKNEGYSSRFNNEQNIKIIVNLFKGLYVFVAISIILVFIFIFNIIKVKEFIDQPLKKIESTLSNISDKVKFKDSKKYLDEYLLEDDSKTINEFKYLIKMILKLVEGNLVLKKQQLKANDLDLMHLHNEIQPINMVKFNRYIVFENKILESIDKNQYCLELTEKSGNEMVNDDKLTNSAIYTEIIQKKFLQEKNTKISHDFSGINKYSEENFKTKYQFLDFEEFKSGKIKYDIDDIFKADWMKVDEILDSFYLEVNERYMENWYKDDTNCEVLYEVYDDIFNN